MLSFNLAETYLANIYCAIGLVKQTQKTNFVYLTTKNKVSIWLKNMGICECSYI